VTAIVNIEFLDAADAVAGKADGSDADGAASSPGLEPGLDWQPL
jgi:hypothetical protein